MEKGMMVLLLLAVLGAVGFFMYKKGYFHSEVARVESAFHRAEQGAENLAHKVEKKF